MNLNDLKKASTFCVKTIVPIVGIGTTSPSAKLDVVGASGTTMRIADGNQAVGKVLTSDANGFASWQAASGGGVNIQVFTSSGTWTKPSSGTLVNIRCWAAVVAAVLLQQWFPEWMAWLQKIAVTTAAATGAAIVVALAVFSACE